MNRNIYRLVKNQFGLWVVAPEHVRAQGKGGSKARKALLGLSLAFSLSGNFALAEDHVGLPNQCATCGGAAGWLAYGLANYQVTGNTAIISQMTDSAILNWKDFNVASGNQVIFQRVADLLNLKAIDGASFSTLNRIWDKDPSVIAGRIGTVANQQANLMFINQNGIIFANGAQVDVNTLTASSLNMTDEVFKKPISDNPNDAKFRFGLDGVTENVAGFVKVMEGAKITTGTGGRVMLIAPTVTNRGEINTPNGQTILAAGSAVYLQASDSANLRGFLVQVDNKSLADGDGKNNGIEKLLNSDFSSYKLTKDKLIETSDITKDESGVLRVNVTAKYLNDSTEVLKDATGATLLDENGKPIPLHKAGDVVRAGDQVALGDNVRVFDEVKNDITVAATSKLVTRAVYREDSISVLKGADGSPILDANGKTIPIYKKGDIVNAGTEVYAGDKITELRGAEDVYDKSGNATNASISVNDLGGTLTASKGNITMVGLAVNQMGRATATTAYNANGSIFLHAVTDQGVNKTGKVTLGNDSKTEVLIDANDQTKGLASALTRSKVDVLGKEISVKSNAQITVPSGIVNLSATTNPGPMGEYVSRLVAPEIKKPTTPFQVTSGGVVPTGAKVLVESGAKIDVSGLDAEVNAQDNVQKIKLLGAELADSPVNRSVLRGKEVYVDLGKGSPLIANLAEYENKVEKTIVARSTDAGTIRIQAEDEAIVQSGTKFDLSGGKTTYVGGVVNVSKLVGADGKTYDISSADPTRQYTGLANEFVDNDLKWGVTRTYSRTLSEFVPTYTAGGNAGLLLLNARSAYFGGDIDGATLAGAFQLRNGNLPLSATFQLGNNKIGNEFGLNQNVWIDNLSDSLASDNLLTGDQKGNLHLSSSLFGQGKVGRLELNTNKNVTVNSALKMAEGGSVDINAAKVNVNADIVTTKANVDLNNDLLRSDGIKREGDQRNVFYVANTFEDVLNRDVLTKSGSITINATNNDFNPSNVPEINIGKSVTLQSSGYWVNELFGFLSTQPTRLISAGDITLKADYKDNGSSVNSRVVLEEGATLDVKGGALLDGSRKISFGSGGNVTLFATEIASTQPLQTHLKGESFGDAGTLSVTSDKVLIGANSTSELSLNTDFFKQGFANYEVKGLSSLTVAENANVVVQTKNLELNQQFRTTTSSSNVGDVASVVTLNDALRKAANLTLKATSRAEGSDGSVALSGANTSTLTIEKGAQITTDLGAKVALMATKSLEIAGKVNAPAGEIAVTLDNGLGLTDNTQRIHLTETAELSAAGAAKLFPDSRGFTKGQIFDGGKVSLIANVGYVDTERGSLINVRGADPTRVDLFSLGSGTFASNAGEVKIVGNTGLYLDGGFDARASGAPYRGGNISVSMEATNINPELVLHAGDFSSSFPNGLSPDGLQDVNDSKQYKQGYVNPTQLQNAGFESIHLTSNDSIMLENGASFGAGKPLHSVQLNAANIISNTTNNVTINADMVAMGNRELDGQGAANKTTTAGPGGLTVNAGYIELSGNTAYDGFSNLDLKSTGEIRLTGVQTTTGIEGTGKLDTQANLSLASNVVSPASLVTFDIITGGDVKFNFMPRSINIKPLSALGNLNVTANNIEQNGRIVAPFGTVKLDAKNSLKLNQGSETSVVAGSGQIIPFGSTQNGKDWFFDKDNPNIVDVDESVTTLKSKNIVLTGSKVTVNTGAVLDISSAGDLQASEFTVGTGGTSDILEKAGYYAILPDYEGGVAPTDVIYEAPLAGKSVYLSESNNLKAGNYVLLPAKYALLPGALAIKVTDGVTDVLPGSNYLKSDGIAVVGGFLTDQRFKESDVGANRWTGFELMTQDQVRARSEYALTYASKFFANNPDSAKVQDAGLLQIAVKSDFPSELTLKGTINSKAAAGGKGAGLDVSADQLALVSQSAKASLAAGEVALDIGELNDLNIDSLLLGGERMRDGNKTTITVKSKQVRIDNIAGQGEAALTGSEVMLAAKDDIKLQRNAAIDAVGQSGNAGTYEIKGDAAFVRAAATDALLNHTDPKSLTGNISGDAGTRVTSAQSVMLDATKNNLFLGELSKDGGALPINLLVSAGLINVGEIPSSAVGYNLDSATLNRFKNADNLKLSSYSTIDFYGNAALGLKDDKGYSINNLTLQAGALRGLGNAGNTVNVQAKTLAFANPNAVNNAVTSTGQAQLNLVADKFGLGIGDKTISGFSKININAAEVVAQGQVDTPNKGTLNLGVNTQINTARMGGETGADQTINNTAALSVKQLPNTNLAASNTFGNSWALKANTLNVDTLMQTKGGNITLTATTGDVNLGQSAVLDASDKNVVFFDVTKPVGAGVITLKSEQGNVVAAQGSRIDVSSSLGANAGTVNAQAINGAVDIAQATFAGNSSVDSKGVEGKAGTLNVDAKTVAKNVGDKTDEEFAKLNQNNFDQLNQKLNAGDFTEKRDFRLRSGNLNLTQQTTGTMNAHELNIAVDAGALTVDNAINASGAKGGEVSLFARDDVKLGNQANINASATAAGQKGGQVIIGTSAGQLDLQGGVINVADSQGKDSGEVLLRAPRTNTTVAVKPLNTDIQGASSVVLEGVKVYENISTFNQTVANTILADNATFMNSKNSITNGLGAEVASLSNKFRLRGGAEVRSTGNMVVSQDISLYQNNRAGGEPGTLTLRANGDLTFNGSLSDGFVNATTTAAIDPNRQESWSYRLVAGADQSAANPLAVIQPTLDTDGSKRGDFNLATGKLIRTGTGDIEIAAAGNFNLANQTSVIYTAGRIADTPAGFNYVGSSTNNRLPVNANNFTRDGGNISLNVAGDITGSATNQLYSNWLFRQGRTDDAGTFTGLQTAWWVRFDQFQQGIGALGGGDIAVNAGGAIRDLSVSSATNGRMAAAVASEDKLVVLGGGDVDVRAAGDILGGQYYAGKGKLNIDAQSVKASTRQTTIALGDAQANVLAKNDIAVNIINPTMVVQSYAANPTTTFVDTGFNLYGTLDNKRTFFSTYTDDTAVTLQSRIGDVSIGNDVTNLLNTNAVNGLARPLVVNTSGTGVGSFGLQNIQNVLKVVPGTVQAYAYGGDVNVTRDMYLYPSPKGNLELLAQNNVNINSGKAAQATPVNIVMADISYREVADARGALRKVTLSNGKSVSDASESITSSTSNALYHGFVNEEIKDEKGNVVGLRPVAIRKNDTEAVKIYAVNGDVNGDTKSTSFSNKLVVPKAIQVRAGNDFKNIGIAAQNMRDTDVSYIKAGRDIVFDTNTVQDDQQFKVGGSGRLDVEAGRDIDLGSSMGIMTIGNRENSYLPNGGADIHIAVGVPNGIDYVGAIARLESMLKLAISSGKPISDSALWQAAWLVGNTSLENAYAEIIKNTNSQIKLLDKENKAAINQLISDSNEKVATLINNEKQGANLETLLAKLDSLKTQSLAVQESRVRSMFYQALRDTGRDYNEPISPYVGQFNRGYDTTELLFPGVSEKNADGTAKNYAGNLSFPLSSIRTVNGGDIEFMAPGGRALVGYTQISDDVLSLYKGYEDGVPRNKTVTGMLTLEEGAIRGFTFGDVLVNQSRVLTVGGGDILLWSSEGNLDAGKGKRTAVNVPPPVIKLDKSGNVVVTLPNAATGSGIGALGDNAGDVDLLAPKGTIDAGDAGIRARNVNLAAQTVLNAANITATGSSSGTQVASAGALSGTLTGAAGAGDPSKAVSDAVKQSTQAPAEPFKKAPSPSFINVEVVSIGQ